MSRTWEDLEDWEKDIVYKLAWMRLWDRLKKRAEAEGKEFTVADGEAIPHETIMEFLREEARAKPPVVGD